MCCSLSFFNQFGSFGDNIFNRNSVHVGDVMKDKTYRIIITAIVIIGIISTVALSAYTVYLHGHCSILAYIASEGI